MDHVRKRNGYFITYNKRCKHPSLRAFHNKPNYVCMKCGSECQFCDGCEKVFTISTLKKNGGICGRCDSSGGSGGLPHLIIEPANHFHPQQLPLHLLFPPGLFSRGDSSEETHPRLPPPGLPTPVSELRTNPEEEEEEDDIVMEGVVRRVLAEDSQKKLWLIEWDGDDHASWEDYDTVKNSRVFREYIERQMAIRDGLPVPQETQGGNPFLM